MKSAFTVLLAFFSILLLLKCSGISDPADKTQEPKALPPTIYTSPAGSFNFHDTLTNALISGTSSSSSKISIAELTGGTEAPDSAKRIRIQVQSADSLILKFSVSIGERIFMYAYGPFSGLGSGKRDSLSWFALPYEQVNDSVFFELPKTLLGLSKSIPITGWKGFQDFAIRRVLPTEPLGVATAQVEQLFKDVTNQWLAILPTAMADTLKKRMASTHKPSITVSTGEGNNSYQGQWDILGFTRPRCQFSFDKDVYVGSIAHEFGHYLSHVYAGEEVFGTIMDLAPDANHAVGIVYNPRSTVTEEYAYLSELILTGKVGLSNLTPTSARTFITGQANNQGPDFLDYPSIEGFSALCTYRFFATETLVTDFEIKQVRVPVLGVGLANTALMYRSQATTGDEWFASLAALAGHNGRRLAFWTAVEPLGYTYSVHGRVLDTTGKAIEGAHVFAENNVDGRIYRTLMSTKTGTDGAFWLRRTFADSTTLVVTTNSDKDTSRFAFYIDPIKPTNRNIDNVDLKLNPKSTILYIKSIMPKKGMAGETVVLTGIGFGKTPSQLTFQGQKISSLSWSDSVITFEVPTGSGQNAIYITVGNSKSNTVYFTYGMFIKKIDPPTFHPTDTVRIYGKGFAGFGYNPIYLNVNFGNRGANIILASDSLYIVRPHLEVRSGKLQIITPSGLDSSNIIDYTIKPPEIFHVSPDSQEPGQQVTITGKGFGDNSIMKDSKLWIGNTDLTLLTKWTDTLLSFTMPVGVKSGVLKVEKGSLISNSISIGILQPSISFNSSSYHLEWGDSLILSPTIIGTSSTTLWYYGSIQTVANGNQYTYRARTVGFWTDTIIVRLKNDTTIADTTYIDIKPKFPLKQNVQAYLSTLGTSSINGEPPNPISVSLAFPTYTQTALATRTAQGYELIIDSTIYNGSKIKGSLVITFNFTDSVRASFNINYFETKTTGETLEWSYILENIVATNFELGNIVFQTRGDAACTKIKQFSYKNIVPFGTKLNTVIYDNITCNQYASVGGLVKK